MTLQRFSPNFKQKYSAKCFFFFLPEKKYISNPLSFILELLPNIISPPSLCSCLNRFRQLCLSFHHRPWNTHFFHQEWKRQRGIKCILEHSCTERKQKVPVFNHYLKSHVATMYSSLSILWFITTCRTCYEKHLHWQADH